MTRAKKVMEATTDPLDAMLARLQLSGIRDQLDSLLDEAARANLSARETLILLCEREIARKDHRRIEMALKLAHFPTVKELAGFDFEAQPSIDPKQIRLTESEIKAAMSKVPARDLQALHVLEPNDRGRPELELAGFRQIVGQQCHRHAPGDTSSPHIYIMILPAMGEAFAC